MLLILSLSIFWHYQILNREALTKTIKEFEAANPDVKVQELFKDLTNLATEIQAARMYAPPNYKLPSCYEEGISKCQSTR